MGAAIKGNKTRLYWILPLLTIWAILSTSILSKNRQYPTNPELSHRKPFKNATNYSIWIVSSSSSLSSNSDQHTSSSSLEWRTLSWRQLASDWDRSTQFQDLIHLAKPVPQTIEPMLSTKLILQCLPKEASTTLRSSCKILITDDCPSHLKLHQRQDPFGYRNIDDLFYGISACPKVNHFCVQGGDLNMDLFSYPKSTSHHVIDDDVNNDDDEDEDENQKINGNKQTNGNNNEQSEVTQTLTPSETVLLEPLHMVHLVPFRNFDDWADSALSHIYKIDGHCNRINEILEQCLGYRELYVELYSKAVLAGLISLHLESIRTQVAPHHKHQIVLYNYSEADTILTKLSHFYNLKVMPQTHVKLKEKSLVEKQVTCSPETLERFHSCQDEKLKNLNLFHGILEIEKKKRRWEHRTVIDIVAKARKRERGQSDNEPDEMDVMDEQ